MMAGHYMYNGLHSTTEQNLTLFCTERTLAAVRPLIDQSERMMDGVRTYAVMHKMNAINCSWAGFHILMASNYTSRTGLYVYCVADSIQAHVRDSSHTAVIHQSIKTTVRLYTYGD